MKVIKNKYLFNTALNFVFRLINMSITYLTIPLTLKYLNNERYGIWQTILTIISWAALSNFGIGNGLRNKVTKCVTENDNKRLKEYISNAYIYITVISIVIFVVGIFATFFINTNAVFRGNTLSRYEIIISLVIVIVNFCINFILGLSSSIAFGIHKSSLVNLFQTITSLLTLAGLIILRKFTNASLINIAILYLVANSFSNIVFTAVIVIDKKFRPSIKYHNKEVGRDLIGIGLEFFILQIATLVLFSTDNFIISSFIGAEKVTAYSITAKLFQVISTIYSILLIQLWSSVAEATIKENFNWIKNAICKLLFLLIPTAIVIIGILIKFNLITKLWLGKNLVVDNKLIYLCAFYAWLICFNGIFVNVQNGMGKIRIQTISAIISCLVNIPLAIILIKVFNLGTIGVMLSNIICLLISTVMCSIDVYIKIKRRVNKNENCNKLC
ncbi:oligosaccharide flippase family protein [Clostridium hydrogenum]|uniref:oligosaccharide flippase family protein n=1 Tax=Clostridium hydrogenum TaxID=2855764 RepID=UPI001F3E21D2|nr:oligosaccharide flippase family protein [Clostridium hydrogenum]